ncbi:hypothetical protein HMPREF9120_00637 [Neisseria sp. oral taxon 020 str. F0370]|nr:hypothetical protein HMPREF9120_00637 [Neisseria sp. oral taxon 020 str. F0370]
MMFPCGWFSDGIKVCRLFFKLFLYYAQLEYNMQGRLKTGLRYRSGLTKIRTRRRSRRQYK